MEFIEAAREASLAALLTYAVLVTLAHIFQWQRFSQMHTLGVVVGCVLGAGLGAQLQLAGLVKYLLMGVAVGAFSYLFGMLKTRFPLRAT